MLSDTDLKEFIEPILHRRLAKLGLKDFFLESGEDHDGDPALFVVTRFLPSEEEIDATALLDVTREIREQLHERGDPRLPYVRFTSDAPGEVAA